MPASDPVSLVTLMPPQSSEAFADPASVPALLTTALRQLPSRSWMVPPMRRTSLPCTTGVEVLVSVAAPRTWEFVVSFRRGLIFTEIGCVESAPARAKTIGRPK